MKKTSKQLFSTLCFLLVLSMSIQLSAQQANTGFKYQAVIRDAEGLPIKGADMDIRLSIVSGEEIIYSEIHADETSSNFGIIGINVGSGTFEEGVLDNLLEIDWGSSTYMLRVELSLHDSANGTWVNYGEAPILSVPYAMHAETVKDKDDADADPENELQILRLDANELSISNGNTVTLDIEDTDEQILSLAGTNLSISGGNTVNLAPIINQGGDPSSTNEIQTLSVDGNTISISGDGGNSIELPNQENLQTLELNGNELSISGGNSVRLNTVITENTTDEIQSLELSGNELTITGDGGNTITLPTSGTPQTLSYDDTNNAISISDGNTINLNSIGGDPTDELQELAYDAANYRVRLSNGGGEIDLSNLKDATGNVSGTDDQTLSLNGTVLEIEDGNDVDLADFHQEISYDNTTQELSITDGNSILLPAIGGDPTDELQELEYDAANYRVRLSNGGGEIDLSNLKDTPGNVTGTDDQTLSLNGTVLEIEDGNDVNLQEFKQDLVYDDINNELSITGGNTVTIPSSGTPQTLSYDDMNNAISISDGNTINLNSIGGDPTDELQEIEYDAANYRVRLSNGGGEIDLSNLKDAPGNVTGTDDQTLSLNGTLLEIEDGNDVDLSSLNTDRQQITTAELIGTDLNLEIENGNRVTIDLSSLGGAGGTDDQTIDRAELDNTDLILSLEDGNEVSIDLSSLISTEDTDNQNLTDASLSGTELTIEIEDGNPVTVDLADLVVAGSDNQQLTNAELDGNELVLEIENGNEVRVDLSSLGSTGGDDKQQLRFDPSTNILTLDDGGSPIDLSALAEDTDATNEIQTLSISGNQLTISGAGGNSVNLPSGPSTGSTSSLIDNDEDTRVYLRESDRDQIGFDVDGDQVLSISKNINGNAILDLRSPTGGGNNTFVGSNAGAVAAGSSNSLFGTFAGYNTEGQGNSFFGASAGSSHIEGFSNSFFGYLAGGNIEQGTQNVVIGTSALGTATNASNNVVIGANAGSSATGDGNIMIGVNSGGGFKNSNSIIIGGHSPRRWSSTLGQFETWSDDFIFSIGYFGGTILSGEMDKGSISFGNTSIASGQNSMAMGSETQASGSNSFTHGIETKAIGPHSVALGFYTEAIAPVSVAMGDRTQANGLRSVTLGQSTISNSNNSLVIGEYNDPIVETNTPFSVPNPLLIVGNGGNINNRSNAFEVRDDGKMKVGNSGTYMRNLQGGTIAVGPDNGPNDNEPTIDGYAEIELVFETPFQSTPHLTITARFPKNAENSSFHDVFSTTIKRVDQNGATVLIKREDEDTPWGMDLNLTWWGFEL